MTSGTSPFRPYKQHGSPTHSLDQLRKELSQEALKEAVEKGLKILNPIKKPFRLFVL